MSERQDCHKTRDEAILLVVADRAEMVNTTTFVLARRFSLRVKTGCAALHSFTKN